MEKTFIELPSLTLKSLFEYSQEAYADRPAVGFVGEESMTYRALAEKIVGIQETLRKYGIRSGDKVALYSENMPNWGAVYLAVTTMGAVIVPVLPDFHVSEAMHIAVHAECKAAFVSKKLLDNMLDEAQPPVLSLLVMLNDLEVFDEFSSPSNVDKMMQKLDKEVVVKEDDLAAIIYTSGTTGSSKGVMLTQKNLTFDATASQYLVDIYTEDRFLSVLPMAHTFECTVGFLIPMLNGASISYILKPPTPTVLIRAMGSVKPTFMLTVPLIIEKIYKNKIQPNFEKNFFIRFLYKIPFVRRKLNAIAGKKLIETFGGELRFFGIGGAGVSPSVEKFLREASFPYCIGYGLTETAPILAGTNPSITKYRAIGPALPGVTLELRNQDENGVGILWAKGPNVMKGYYKDPEKTAEVMDEEGWFNTEDIGYFDEDNYFFMSGRSKNIIVGPGGENIYPEQIEAAINAHPLVGDSLVFDAKGTLTARIYLDPEKLDAYFGVTNKSETKMHSKIEALLEEIREEVNGNVSSFSRIRKVIEQREEFVKTPTKKIKRYLYVEADNS